VIDRSWLIPEKNDESIEDIKAVLNVSVETVTEDLE